MKKIKTEFIQPMLLLRTERLPEGPNWFYELKLDGYRALAIKTDGKIQLRSWMPRSVTCTTRPC
jgi:ATP-dependent DNA ligase